MECRHNSISLTEGFPHCLNCGLDFKNGELGKLRKERESKCSHKKLEDGWYASNPPMKRCIDCGGYFKADELR